VCVRACAVSTQVMMPNISFLGHLLGLLVGVCQTSGLLRPLMPSNGGWKKKKMMMMMVMMMMMMIMGHESEVHRKTLLLCNLKPDPLR
jgi:hypothetical protein